MKNKFRTLAKEFWVKTRHERAKAREPLSGQVAKAMPSIGDAFQRSIGAKGPAINRKVII